MKKILNEWKKWLKETAPKDKYYGLRKRAGANPHERAIPDTLRQEDFRSTFKAVLKNFMYSHLAFGQVEDFISNMSDDEKGKIAKDLNVLKHIYRAELAMILWTLIILELGLFLTICQKCQALRLKK